MKSYQRGCIDELADISSFISCYVILWSLDKCRHLHIVATCQAIMISLMALDDVAARTSIEACRPQPFSLLDDGAFSTRCRLALAVVRFLHLSRILGALMPTEISRARARLYIWQHDGASAHHHVSKLRNMPSCTSWRENSSKWRRYHAFYNIFWFYYKVSAISRLSRYVSLAWWYSHLSYRPTAAWLVMEQLIHNLRLQCYRHHSSWWSRKYYNETHADSASFSIACLFALMASGRIDLTSLTLSCTDELAKYLFPAMIFVGDLMAAILTPWWWH